MSKHPDPQNGSRCKEPDYARSAAVAKQLAQAYTERSFLPHWIDHSNSFWYRTSAGKGRFSFYFCDAEKAEQRAILDVEQQDEHLQGHYGKDKLEALLITSIDPSKDGGQVR